MSLVSAVRFLGRTRSTEGSPHDVYPLEPVWPLPRDNSKWSSEAILEQFAKYDSWHYAYQFEGGVSPPLSPYQKQGRAGDIDRPLRRFHHFMPYLVKAAGGSLRGKRVLDIACNSGFWSVQCALMGAEVIGFDARPELIEQANLIKSVVGCQNLRFQVLDFWDMSPPTLGSAFDIVLNLGILYHLSDPLQALRRTVTMAREYVLLDTEVYPSNDSILKLRWEEPDYIRSAARSGMVVIPSKSAVELILKELAVSEWYEIPIQHDMPQDYREHRRTSWLIKV
jgi:SAM-dependent methyltransferase